MSTKNLMLPGNPRYQPKNLQEIFGYDNLMVPVGEVELATMQVLGEIGVIPSNDINLLTADVIERILQIPTTEVDVLERKETKHDIRAWVRLAQQILPVPLRRWAHVPLTSYDSLDTARVLQFVRAHNQVLKPSIKEVLGIFINLTRKFSGQLQIGRTHGQHALPITVGFWLATILSRIVYNAKAMEVSASQLVGKISGAVGAHNAQVGLGIFEKCGLVPFEERVLTKLDLKPAPISTQILPPEPLAYFLHSCIMLSAAFGQFGEDGRHLMRTEIAEVSEKFEKGAVGSSTMAHKRNPVNFEGLKSAWLKNKNEYGKVLDTLISEHQRDLTGSAVARDFPIMLVNLATQLGILLRKNDAGEPFLANVSVDPVACQRNFDQTASLVLSEPIYIALQMAGYNADAHELVNHRAVPLAQSESISLIEAVERIAATDDQVKKALDAIPRDIITLLYSPERYTGDAQEKALKIASAAEAFLF